MKKYKIDAIDIEFDSENKAVFSSQEMAAARKLLTLHGECKCNHELFVKILEAKDSGMITFLIKQGIDRFILQINKLVEVLEKEKGNG